MHECIFAFMHVVSTVSDLWRALVHFHLNFTSGALETKTNCSRCGKLRSVICLTTYNVYWWLDGETVERQTTIKRSWVRLPIGSLSNGYYSGG